MIGNSARRLVCEKISQSCLSKICVVVDKTKFINISNLKIRFSYVLCTYSKNALTYQLVHINYK